MSAWRRINHCHDYRATCDGCERVMSSLDAWIHQNDPFNTYCENCAGSPAEQAAVEASIARDPNE